MDAVPLPCSGAAGRSTSTLFDGPADALQSLADDGARVITTVALAVLAALALGSPADAKQRWRRCPEADGPKCTTVRVPLDRSGARDGERRPARRARGVRAQARPLPDVPLRRARRGRRVRDDRCCSSCRSWRPLHRDRLRPARDGRQRAAALLRARARRAAALHLRRGEVRAAARARARLLHDARHRRRHGGDPQGRRRAQADAVRDLLRHGARARVRARAPGPRRPAAPRLRRGPGRERSRSGWPGSARWGRRWRRCAPTAAAG